MGKQGKPTPDAIRDFVIKSKMNAPSLSYREIAEKVQAAFGEGARIDQSTVGRILRAANLGGSGTHPVSIDLQPGDSGLDWQGHRQLMLAALNDLKGIDVIPVHNLDIATWWSRPEVSDPIMIAPCSSTSHLAAGI